jgi:hypothetical protein
MNATFRQKNPIYQNVGILSFLHNKMRHASKNKKDRSERKIQQRKTVPEYKPVESSNEAYDGYKYLKNDPVIRNVSVTMQHKDDIHAQIEQIYYRSLPQIRVRKYVTTQIMSILSENK